MKWKWTDHIMIQLKERKIPKELVDATLIAPDKIVKGKHKRKIYQKIKGGKLIRVITEGDTLITVYLTNRIKKYMGE